MHFSVSTIAAVALVFAAAEAAPHRGHGGGRNSTNGAGEQQQGGRGRGRFSGTGGFPFPTGIAGGEQGGQRSRTRSGFPGTGGGLLPTGLPSGFPTELPSGFPSGFPSGTGGASFPTQTAPAELPSGLPEDLSTVSFEFPATGLPEEAAAAEDEDKEEDETTTTTAASSEPTGSDDEDSDSDASSSAATFTATPTSGGNPGNSSSSGAASTYLPASTAASTTFPEAAGESTLSEPMVVTGEFDGGMVRFGRGIDCSGQSEGGDSDAVFQIEEGGTLKNVIIGADQSEGVHCLGACTIENVWWEAVCEDALTIKQTSGVSYVVGGGAKGASDKVVQHNGGGTVSISGFYVSDFGKLYRSCGNCDEMFERHVILDNVIADGGSATLVGINTNYGDTATITNSCITNTDPICTEFEGNDTGDEPTEISTGISASCIYTEADVSAC